VCGDGGGGGGGGGGGVRCAGAGICVGAVRGNQSLSWLKLSLRDYITSAQCVKL